MFPAEVCDGVDNDCDGETDEDFATLGQACDVGQGACAASGVLVCGDANNVVCGATEGTPSTETCDGIDNDCDGVVDEDDAGQALTQTCYDGPDGTQDVGICTSGIQTCADGAFGTCDGQVTPGTEICDQLDNDCDGQDDNLAEGSCDCEPGDVRDCYSGPDGTEGIGVCTGGTQTCADDGTGYGPCDGEVVPEAEVCDDVDHDCNGDPSNAPGTNEACTNGVGACEAAGVTACGEDGTIVCNATPGEPGDEVCDGLDNDCNGVDDDVVGAGDVCSVGAGACEATGVRVCDVEALALVCDATPGTAEDEVCDGIDNDCDGDIDEDDDGAALTQTCYDGPDGTEGVGICTGGTQTCADGAFGACDGQVTPGTEICDQLDNDCDGEDDNIEVGTCACEPGDVRDCYSGPDGTEGVGICTGGTQTCADDGTGYGPCEGEVVPEVEVCDDVDHDCNGDPTNAPGTAEACTNGVGACEVAGVTVCAPDGAIVCNATPGLPGLELCDGIDNDCNGVDDDVLGVGDVCTNGVGACEAAGVRVCDLVAEALTCDATPGTPEVEACDGVDNDCDGDIDEDEDGAALTQACYSGPDGTEGVGICTGGTQTCADGAFGVCDGEVVPGTEICDQLDNDCDGEDDNIAVGTCVCEPGDVRDCYSGPDGTEGVGICTGGTQTCADDGTGYGPCDGEVVPEVEVCDDVDHDCNGDPTNAPGTNQACTNGVGACEAAGVTVCAPDGAIVCDATPGTPVAETCDGVDNDCNGVDDDVVGLGDACTNGVGACEATGVRVCDLVAEALVCDATPGAPAAEICDGIDNDCNGVDDDVVGLGDACTNGVGACEAAGVQVCDLVAEALVCDATPGAPQAETCDGVDNDCNGVDDDVIGLGDACTNGVGACEAAGVRVCDLVAEALVCDATPGAPAAEICDGLDNDCNGVDDDVVGLGDACTNGVGACEAAGVQVCDVVGQTLVCDATPGAPVAETCDGVDNDCNGVDDDVVGLGDACTNGVGACEAAGVQVCDLVAEALVCDATPGAPQAETCDGVDNDCNGVDDDVVGLGDACTNGVGACEAAGVQVCDLVAEALVCNATPGAPAAEICDGLDNDCNGVDDDVVGLGDACTGGVGACEAAGVQVCDVVAEALVCDATPGVPTPEICDGVDNDCNGVDDDVVGAGIACSEGLGACLVNGTLVCDLVGGALECDAIAGTPEAEICDGIDNDCNGVDDDVVGLGDACTEGEGACEASGVLECDVVAEALVCGAIAGTPEAEICDGLDNDCNGVVDDAPGTGVPCSEGLGICVSNGVQVCDPVGGVLVCDAPVIPPQAEACGDGLDNDCDGDIDCSDTSCDSAPDCVCGNAAFNSGETCDDGNRIDGDGCDSVCQEEPTYACTLPIASLCPNGQPADTVGLTQGSNLPGIGGIGGAPFADACPEGQLITGFDFAAGRWNGVLHGRDFITKARARCSVFSEFDSELYLVSSGDRTPTRGDTNTFNNTLDCPAGHAVVGYKGWEDFNDDGTISYLSGVQILCAPVSLDGGNNLVVGDTVRTAEIGNRNNLVGEFECGAGEIVGAFAGRSGGIIDLFTLRCDGTAPACRLPSQCQVPCGNSALDLGETCDDGNMTAGDGCSPTCQIEVGWGCEESDSAVCQGGDDPTTLALTPQGALPETGGAGGNAGSLACPGGQVTVGLELRLTRPSIGEPDSVYALQALCAVVQRVDGEVILSDAPSTDRIGSGGGMNHTLRCPRNHAVVGYDGWEMTPGANTIVSALRLSCGRLEEGGGGSIVVGDAVSTVVHGTQDTFAGSFECPAGQLVQAYEARTSGLVDAFTVRCGSIDDDACHEPSECYPICGNSARENAEQCDDGNNVSGDGCSATCQREGSAACDRPNVVDCNGQPSDTVRLNPTNALAQIGRPAGGDFFADSCKEGEVITGINFHAGDRIFMDANPILKIRARCSTVSIEGGELRLLPGKHLTERGDVFEDANGLRDCPEDHIVVGYTGWTADEIIEGQLFSSLGVRCAPVAAQGGTLAITGPAIELDRAGPNTTLVGTFDCPAGEAAIGQAGWEEFDGINGFYLQCGAIEPGCRSASHCETPHNCGDGVLENGEECDDGNTTNGDGCASDCRHEFGLHCGPPEAQDCGGAPPDTVQLQTQGLLTSTGAAGGTPFVGDCPGDQILQGVDVAYGATRIRGVRTICSEAYVTSEVDVLGAVNSKWFGDNEGLGFYPLLCPQGHAVVGYEGWLSTEGDALGKLSLRCAPLDRVGDAVTVSTPTFSTITAGRGDGATFQGTFECPAGQIASGIEGQSSTQVNQFTLRCASVSTGCRAPGACFGIPVCIYDFDDGVLPAAFTTTGAASWSVNPTGGEGGTGAAQNDPLPPSPSVANLRLDGVVFGDYGRLEFRYRFADEVFFERFRFSLNGEELLLVISGDDWRTFYTSDVEPGAQDVVWTHDSGPFDGDASSNTRIDTIILHDVVCD